jgi:hypothetical protein
MPPLNETARPRHEWADAGGLAVGGSNRYIVRALCLAR